MEDRKPSDVASPPWRASSLPVEVDCRRPLTEITGAGRRFAFVTSCFHAASCGSEINDSLYDAAQRTDRAAIQTKRLLEGRLVILAEPEIETGGIAGSSGPTGGVVLERRCHRSQDRRTLSGAIWRARNQAGTTAMRISHD